MRVAIFLSEERKGASLFSRSFSVNDKKEESQGSFSRKSVSVQVSCPSAWTFHLYRKIVIDREFHFKTSLPHYYVLVFFFFLVSGFYLRYPARKEDFMENSFFYREILIISSLLCSLVTV